MSMNKKAQLTQGFFLIAGVIFVVALIIITYSFGASLFKSFKHTDNTLKGLSDSIADVAENYETGTGKSFLLNLDMDSAIFILNPESDFRFDSQQYALSYAKYLQRPESCIDNALCICSCKQITFVDVGKDANFKPRHDIKCADMQCQSLVGYSVPARTYMGDVFDIDQQTESFRNQHFWENSQVVANFEQLYNYNLGGPKPIFAGYTSTQGYSSVIIKKISVSPPVISICFKDDCISQSGVLMQEQECPYERCSQIPSEMSCNNPANVPGCKDTQLDCEWDYPSNKCVYRG